MSKQMDRATMAAYQRARRAKMKAAALAAVNPVVNPPCQSPVKPAAVPCTSCKQLRANLATATADCSRLLADADRLKAEMSRLASALATMVDQQQTDRQAAQPTSSPQHSGRPTEKMTDSDALRQPVIAAKVDRINTFGRNPVIGSARM